MKNVLIIGLGLLGGSYAKALTKKGYNVWAIDLSQESIDYALENKIIQSGTTTVSPEFINFADTVVFALYPNVFIKWAQENGHLFKEGTIITDVTGVKGGVIEKIQSLLPSGVEFISAHPMAGREVSGVQFSDDSIFKNANYLVVPSESNTKRAIDECVFLGQELGFKSVSVITPTQHDDMIAFLSQLTHCIAVALMCCNPNEGLEAYTGDSFRDLTRIAKINDEMWSELFLLNKDALLKQMDRFKESFDELYNSVRLSDREKMRDMMRTSTQRRKRFDIVKEKK